MRLPIRSEAEAFRLAVGVAAAAIASIALGVAFDSLTGTLFAAAVAAVALIAYLRAPNPDRIPVLAEAAHAGAHPDAEPGRHHLLVVANVPLYGDALRREILDRSGNTAQIDVLAPVQLSRIHGVMTDVDRERARARKVLSSSIAWAESQGLDIRGHVGDDDPITSLADELRAFGGDEVIVVTHPPETETRQEVRELERLRAELDVPVVQVRLDA